MKRVIRAASMTLLSTLVLGSSSLSADPPYMATGIKIGYDPGYDPAEHEGLGQELVVVDSASLTIIPLKITGSLKPYTYFDTDLGQNVTIPGLVIRTTGFKLGVAELCYGCVARDPAAGSPAVTDPSDPNAPEPGGAINLFGIVEFDDIRVGVTNFGVDFRTGIQFDGEIYFADLFGGRVFRIEGQWVLRQPQRTALFALRVEPETQLHTAHVLRQRDCLCYRRVAVLLLNRLRDAKAYRPLRAVILFHRIRGRKHGV